MQLGSGGAVIPLPAASLAKSPAEGPGKLNFNCLNCRRLAYYLLTFYVKFSAL